jgi:hypothetical protein
LFFLYRCSIRSGRSSSSQRAAGRNPNLSLSYFFVSQMKEFNSIF